MSWVNDLASAAGVPAGAATLAVAMYAACAAAEKAARPEALQDIGRILRDTTWERSVRPSAIIGRVFNWTFGERHLSWRCIVVSMSATFTFIYSAGLATGVSNRLFDPIAPLAIALYGGLSDYIALGKTRLVLRLPRQKLSMLGNIVLVLCDAVLSLCISTAAVIGLWSLGSDKMGDIVAGTLAVVTFRKLVPGDIFIASTLLTSIWITLILLSTIVLKLLAPIHRFTAWFFDVQKHPVQAIGIIAGALVMIASLIWTVLRAMI